MRLDYGVVRAPTRILFGQGQRRALGRVVAELSDRVLVCTDARFAGLDVMAQMRADFASNGVTVEVFDGTEPELPLGGVLACVERYRGFAPGAVVGLGGGSCLDMAKLVALLLSHDGPVSAYYGEHKVPGPVIPVVAVPTTSGTGSEATPVAVLADPERAMKVGVSSPFLIPHTAICDPELTLTCPKGLTAISGADALAHAIEAFAAVTREPDPEMALTRVFVGKNGLSDVLALAAIRLIHANLRTAVADGADLEARAAVMMGSTLAGLAFGAGGTSAAHAIQYPIGAMTHTAHGLGIGVLLPYAIDFNLEAAEAAYAEIGRAIGAAPAGGDDRDAALAARDAVRSLFADIGIPETLREIGVAEDSLAKIAEMSMAAARLVDNNPRRLDPAAVEDILNRAMSGYGAMSGTGAMSGSGSRPDSAARDRSAAPAA